MDVARVAKFSTRYSVFGLIGMYFLCGMLDVAVFVAAAELLEGGGFLAVVVMTHVACGGVLSRFVSSRIVWWNQADNIENVYRAKVSLFVTWPTAVPRLIWRVAVSKML